MTEALRPSLHTPELRDFGIAARFEAHFNGIINFCIQRAVAGDVGHHARAFGQINKGYGIGRFFAEHGGGARWTMVML